jgi:acyl-CoA thioesterase-1
MNVLRLGLLVWAAASAASSQRNVVLFLGDSLTAGYGVSAEEAYPSLLDARWKAAGSPWRARNAGTSGETTAGALESLDWSLAPDVRLLVLAIGANDGLRGLSAAQSEKNIARIIEKARKKGVAVALAGMKVPPNYGREYARDFEAVYPRLAKRYRLKLLPFLLEGVAGHPELNIQDGIHPNAAGQRVVARRVGEFLDKQGLLK